MRSGEIEFVELDETFVGGLPVRSPKRPLGMLRDPNLERAWSAVLGQNPPGPLASIYTDHAAEAGSFYTQVVGYRCESIGDVMRGHVMARVPGGRYARFFSTGEFPDVVSNLWQQVREAEDAGQLDRAFTGAFECYPHAYRIDLYIAVGSLSRSNCHGL
ncbi:GyrI-like domain-containing protein [Rhodococcus tukisamuensis]|uniref:Predicted transcriptional regulator YdeE, contains AraC-type DNA-binding domain n=1 Tax=Rhodococcus tukisamuensis TaxID=168276 RepID=A0A1G7AQV5_9NOCA|nr:GyrI-like domain-containing protein [Rhodococcus tukisamuensis]SDE16296.1 Predicted transcriptional regulator YdeE, contains AraC-type DNA-binding domain [Rhodococcus tukisamuensis]